MENDNGQGQQVSLADLVIADLSEQLAAKSRELAILKAQFKQLESFVRAHKDVLGLVEHPNGDLTSGPSLPEPPAPRPSARNGRAPTNTGS